MGALSVRTVFIEQNFQKSLEAIMAISKVTLVAFIVIGLMAMINVSEGRDLRDAFIDLLMKRYETEEVAKRATDCGSGAEAEGPFSRKCRSSCKSNERHVGMFDDKCSGSKCCMCHSRWGSCTVE